MNKKQRLIAEAERLRVPLKRSIHGAALSPKKIRKAIKLFLMKKD